MSIDPYKHHHSQVENISWARLGQLLIQLTEKIRSDWQPEIIVGIAKGGVIPASFISSALQLNFFPIRLSSRDNEKVIHQEPVWYVYPTAAVKNKKVLLADDICVAGRTLTMAKKQILKLKAKEVRTATIAIHKKSMRPDYVVLESDALIIWPWDRDIFNGKKWLMNPEYLEELQEIEQIEKKHPETNPGTCVPFMF